jgi:flavin-dependent dehydrogenase
MDASTTSPRGGGTNLAHSSALLAATAAASAGAAAAPAQQQPSAAVVQRELLDARRKFSSSLESNVLDFLHYSPLALEECVRTLHTLFDNVLQHPEEPKYRRVRAV